MIEINLIPSVKRELLRARSVRNRVISIAFLVGGASIAAAVVLGLILGGQMAAEMIQDGSIKSKAEKLTSVEDINKVVTIQNQLSKINEQHANKKITSRIFDTIAAIALDSSYNMSFSAIKLDPSQKTISLEGNISGYDGLEVLKKTILMTKVRVERGDEHNEVALTDSITNEEANFGEDSEGKKILQFSFSFVYPEQLLSFVTEESVSIVTPTSRVDVTDSRQGVPDSLFKEKTTTEDSQEDK